jgi:pimeloyl-ACP methyl ester carboxylesterase
LAFLSVILSSVGCPLFSEMRHRSVLGITAARGFHRIHYTEWGEGDNPDVVVCVHGLTRNGRDFDPLAAALCDRYRLLCPDVAGRGDSDWIAQQDYGYAQYCADMAVLIGRSGAERVDWVGTSMGGIIGMLLAAQPNSPIRRLVINDVGAVIPRAAIENIARYVGDNPQFANLDEAADYIARVNAGFGPLTRDDWRALAESSVRRSNGGFVWKRDPAIAAAFTKEAPAEVVLWPVWDRITGPVLVLRGAESDLLPGEVAEQMTRRGPRARLAVIPRTGHAPALRDPAQFALVRDFLLS